MSKHIHPNALVESGAVIGSGTRVRAFAHVMSGARIGDQCEICDHVFIGGDVIVGDQVRIESGAHIGDGARLDDDVVIGPNATVVNSLSQRDQVHSGDRPHTSIRVGVRIGANATIHPGTVIGERAVIEPGSAVQRNVPSLAIISGNPAAIIGYVDAPERAFPRAPKLAQSQSAAEPIGVGGAILYQVPIIADMRGNLSAGEFGKQLPFLPKRYFLVFDVPNRETRGEHAHKTLHQFLVAVLGEIHVVLDDGYRRVEIVLDSRGMGLYVPPKVWGIQYKYSADAVLLVLASDVYDPDDYIRSYSDFLAMLTKES